MLSKWWDLEVHHQAINNNHLKTRGCHLADSHHLTSRECNLVDHPLKTWTVLHQAPDQVVNLPQEVHPLAATATATPAIFSVTHLNEQVGVHLPQIREQGNTHRFRPYYQKPLSIVHRRELYIYLAKVCELNQILAKFFWPSYKKATQVWQTR